MKNKQEYQAKINLFDNDNKLIETRNWYGKVYDLAKSLVNLDGYYAKLRQNFNRKEIVYCVQI